MSVRSISIDGFSPPPCLPQETPAPQLQWLPIASLVVDDAYQREIERAGRRNIQRIAADFDWAFFSPVIVSPVEGGKFAIVDGQHRTTAAALIGKTEVPCQIVIADRRKQARAFAAVNGNVTRQSALSVFRARLGSADADAMALDALARRAGIRILGYPVAAKQMKQGDCMSPAGLATAMARYGGETLFLALRAMTESGQDIRGLVNPLIVGGLCVALSRVPIAEENLGRIFAHVDFAKLVEKQRRDGFGGGRGGIWRHGAAGASAHRQARRLELRGRR